MNTNATAVRAPDRRHSAGGRTPVKRPLDRLGTVDRREPAAFTLVELLVVIAIIALLVTILVPAVAMAHKQAEDVRCRALIAEFGQGAQAYQFDNGYYPGQRDTSILVSGGGQLTGSQILAKCLFTDPAVSPPDDFPLPKYAKIKDKLKDFQTFDGKANCVSDRTNEPLPVLYYPSHLDQTDLNQYQAADNSAHWNKTQADLAALVTDSRFGSSTTPYAPWQFIIIAAGIDRVLGTSDDIHYPASW